MIKNNFLIVISFLLVSCSSVVTQDRKEQENQNRFIDFEILQTSQTGNSTDLKLVVKIPINTIVKPSQETSTVCLSEVSQSLSHYRDRGKFY